MRQRRRRASPSRAPREPRAAAGRDGFSRVRRGTARQRSASSRDTTGVVEPDNAALAEQLERFATMLDLSGAAYYSVRAYRRAAELVRATPAPVAELVRKGNVRALRGIGP